MTKFDFCLPNLGKVVPAGPEWFHEIKFDGYRLRVERDGNQVRLITRGGYDWTKRFPWIAEAALRAARVEAVPHHRLKRHLPVTESIVLPPDVGDYIMSAFCRPHCPKCKDMTMLPQITRGSSGFDIRTFECPACDHVHQRVGGRADPMGSQQTAGWLRGELRAPT